MRAFEVLRPSMLRDAGRQRGTYPLHNHPDSHVRKILKAVAKLRSISSDRRSFS